MKVEAAERPRLLIVAGPNGAGKTTITEAGLAHQWFAGCEYVNPDEIATERREACLREGRSLAFETVFSSPEKVISFTAPLRQGSSGDFFRGNRQPRNQRRPHHASNATRRPRGTVAKAD